MSDGGWRIWIVGCQMADGRFGALLESFKTFQKFDFLSAKIYTTYAGRLADVRFDGTRIIMIVMIYHDNLRSIVSPLMSVFDQQKRYSPQ